MKSNQLRNKLVANLMSSAGDTVNKIKITQRLFQLNDCHILLVSKKELESALFELEMFDAKEADSKQ